MAGSADIVLVASFADVVLVADIVLVTSFADVVLVAGSFGLRGFRC